MNDPPTGAESVAATLAELSDRVYGLCGGHIQPVWDALVDTDAAIVDTRDERAAVHAAHADAAVRDGLGVVMVTAGPGVTNALTGVANADTTGVPLLVVGGKPPTPQHDRGALQALGQREMVEPVTAVARTVQDPERLREYVVEAAATAREHGRPAYLEFPTDVLRPAVAQRPSREHPERPPVQPAPEAVAAAADALAAADRPLAVVGRGVRSPAAAEALAGFLEAGELPALTTAGSKGALGPDHPLELPGARGRAMAEADALLVVGKRLDFTLAYGSEAVFADTALVQVDRDPGALVANRTPEVAVRGDAERVLPALGEAVESGGPLAEPGWLADLQAAHEKRAADLAERKTADEEPIHPYRVCGAIEAATDEPVVICDGGDSLSFGRVALAAHDARGYLDPGPLGCLGVGIPFAVGAAQARPERDVVCLTGDGSAGFNAMELETAVREGLDLTVVVANNAAWNIERYDQRERFGREAGSALEDVRFDLLAEAVGADGRRVEAVAELDDAVAAAVAADGPAVVDVVVDDEAVSPDARNGLPLVPRYQALEAWDASERAARGEEPTYRQ
jgi:acetolactate synthase-1/2/3 large subunit